MDGLKNYFACQHKRRGICMMNFMPCSIACRRRGKCGECRWYFLPARQMPCLECRFLDPDIRKMIEPEEGGKLNGNC